MTASERPGEGPAPAKTTVPDPSDAPDAPDVTTAAVAREQTIAPDEDPAPGDEIAPEQRAPQASETAAPAPSGTGQPVAGHGRHEAAPAPPRPNPVPAGGVVRMETKIGAGQVQLTFPWANPNGAAVFRRGGAVWVVFDAPAAIDVSKAPRGLRQMSGLSAVRGDDYTAVRNAMA